jgi:hypothetical protein
VPSNLKCRENPPPQPFSRLGRVPRTLASLLALAVAGAAAVVLSACGEEDAQLLPGETAREITANLDTVQRLADEGDCVGAESAALQVGEQVETLAGVDPKLKRALEEGAVRLNEVVASCEEELEAVSPEETTDETEPDNADREGDEEEKKEREKEEKKEEKEAEKEEKEAEREEEPSLPPQAKGEGKGLDDEEGTGPGDSGEGGGSSGGVSPSSPAEGDD